MSVKKGMKSRITVVVVGLVLAAFLLFFVVRRSYTVRLTPAVLETYLRSKFPYEKRELIFSARFTDPSVTIDSMTNQVTLAVSATGSATGLRAASSQARATGLVRYEPETGEIFIDSPTVTIQKLEIAGLSERNEERAEAAIQRALQYYLERRPLYRLKKKGPLKSMRVRDGAIEIEIGY